MRERRLFAWDFFFCIRCCIDAKASSLEDMRGRQTALDSVWILPFGQALETAGCRCSLRIWR